MDKDYHYFFSYLYKNRNGEEGQCHTGYKLPSKLNGEHIVGLIDKLKLMYDYTDVVITFFAELDCNCEEDENE